MAGCAVGRTRPLCYGCLDVVAGDIDLNTSFGVLDLDERGFSHDSLGHQTSGDTYGVTRVPNAFTFIYKSGLNIGRKTGYLILGRRIGINPHVSHRLQTLPPYLFLFA